MNHRIALLLLSVCLAGCAGKDVTPYAPGGGAPAVVAQEDDTMRLEGKVASINNGCFADGTCSVTINGVEVVTMTGWSRDTWGKRDPDLQVGDTVVVSCRRTPTGCTLNGDPGYYVRKQE